MGPIDTIADANRAIRTYLAGGPALAADTIAALEEHADRTSRVDAICGIAELLFARRDEIDDDGRRLGAALAAFAAGIGWHGLDQDNRGGRIALALRRDAGDGPPPFIVGQQDPADEPTPLASYLRAPAAEPAPPVAG